MKRYFVLSLLAFALSSSCERSFDPDEQSAGVLNAGDNVIQVYFFLSDSLGYARTEFGVNEDVVFNFGVINKLSEPLLYTKSHGGPPIASFVVLKGDVVFGISDEGYGYPAIVVSGEIPPRDTLACSVSWKSNPFHRNAFEPGDYNATVNPYIRFVDFDLSSHLDTLDFKILDL